MCGFVARFGPGPITPALHSIAHRGLPGRQSVVEDPTGWSIGHVRLPIIGLGTEFDQPMKRGRWTIAFVGEILNYRDFGNYGCDSELAADAWNEKREANFKEFDGFWSVAAIDRNSGCLHLLCDYLAQKPVYYRASEECTAAASELEPLRMMAPVTLDEVYLAAIVKWGYCPETRRTPYNEIKKLLPGEYAQIVPGGVLSRFVVDPLTPFEGNLRREVEDAVERRVLSSDVPVAILVSGGLDSSITYKLAKKHAPLRPYYVSSGLASNAQVEAEERQNLEEVLAGDDYVAATWDEVTMKEALHVMQEPIDLGSLCPQIALSKVVKERVCLTGDGADEMFGGYDRAKRYDSQASDVWHELVAWHLPRLDRVMMRHQIEVRSPFLARRVAGIALTLPWQQRQNKEILRETFRDILPKSIADGRKIPLRTNEIEVSREENSIRMVRQFREQFYGG